MKLNLFILLGILCLIAIPFASAVIPQSGNIVAGWPMNETVGVIVADVYNGNDGLASGGATIVPGLLGNARSFDGVSGIVNISGTAQLDFIGAANQNFTISYWVKRQPATTSETAFSKYDSSGASKYVMMWDYAGGTADYTIWTGAAWYTAHLAAIPYANNEWHHIVFERNTALQELRLYIDGIFASNVAIANTEDASTLVPFTIGADTGGNWPYNGTIDEFVIWNNTLTDSEIARLYGYYFPQTCYPQNLNVEAEWRLNENAGLSAVDSTGHGHDGTIGGVLPPVYSWLSGFWNNSYDSDNILTGVQVPFSPAFYSPQMTVSMWIYPTAFPTWVANDVQFMESGTLNTAAGAWMFYSADGAGTISAFFWQGAFNENHDSTIPFVLNQWNHIVFAYNNTDLSYAFYVNGAPAGTGNFALSYVGGNAASSLGIDSGAGVAGSFQERMDEVVFWNTTLTATEAADLYGRYLNGSCGAPTPPIPPVNVTCTYSICPSSQIDILDVPCCVITPYLNCSTAVNITNIRTNLTSHMVNMTANGDGTYTFIFNETIGQYNMKACNNASMSTVEVGYFDKSLSAWGWIYFLMFLAIPGVLYFLGRKSNDPVFTFMAGTIMLVSGILFTRFGFPSFSNTFITNSVRLTIVLLGAYLLLIAYEEWGGDF